MSDQVSRQPIGRSCSEYLDLSTLKQSPSRRWRGQSRSRISRRVLLCMQTANLGDRKRMITKMSSFQKLLAITILMLSTLANAQPTPPNDPDAVMVLQKCSQALGQPAPNVSFVAQGDRSLATEKNATPVTIKSRGASMVRYEQVSPGGPEVRIVARGKGSSTKAGTRRQMPNRIARYFELEHLPVFLCEIPSTARTVMLKGTEQLGSTTVFHIAVSAGPNVSRTAIAEQLSTAVDLFIDAATYLPVKTKRLIFSPTTISNHSDWETHYSDYRDVQGMKVAFRVTQYMAGTKVNEYVFQSVAVQPVADSDFE